MKESDAIHTTYYRSFVIPEKEEMSYISADSFAFPEENKNIENSLKVNKSKKTLEKLY